MKTSKNTIPIFVTIAVMVAVCIYLYAVEKAYAGGVYVGMTAFTITVPIVAAIQLWKISKGKEIDRQQEPWQKIMMLIFYVAFVVGTIYSLVRSDVYGLFDIMILVLLLYGGIGAPIDKFIIKKYVGNPVIRLSINMISLYILIGVTIFSYLQVAKPMTVKQAVEVVEGKFGEEGYEYIGWLTGNEEKNPMGVYWFADSDDEFDDGINVDVRSGRISNR